MIGELSRPHLKVDNNPKPHSGTSPAMMGLLPLVTGSVMTKDSHLEADNPKHYLGTSPGVMDLRPLVMLSQRAYFIYLFLAISALYHAVLVFLFASFSQFCNSHPSALCIGGLCRLIELSSMFCNLPWGPRRKAGYK